MTNSEHETLRDLLPLLAHDALTGEEVTTVQAHVVSCADCAAEWRAITSAAAVFEDATPRVNTAAILSKLAAPSVGRAGRRVESAPVWPRWTFGIPRAVLAAAASLVLMVTLSITVLRPIFIGGATGVDRVAVGSSAGVSGSPPATAVALASVGGSTLTDLGVDELTQLLHELDHLEATMAAEPRTLSAPITTESEGM